MDIVEVDCEARLRNNGQTAQAKGEKKGKERSQMLCLLPFSLRPLIPRLVVSDLHISLAMGRVFKNVR
jgi:hypothetical protein